MASTPGSTRSGKSRIVSPPAPKSKKPKLQAGELLPEPKLKVLARESDRVYCDICDQSWSIKTQKKKKAVTALNKDKFKRYAEEWKEYDHIYSKIYDKIDWSKESYSNCRKCRHDFFRDREGILKWSSLKNPVKPTADQMDSDVLPSTSAVSENENEPDFGMSPRQSTRKRNSYEVPTSEIDQKPLCIICKTEKMIDALNQV